MREPRATLVAAAQSSTSFIPPLGEEKAQVLTLNLRNRMVFKAAYEAGAVESADFLGQRKVQQTTRGFSGGMPSRTYTSVEEHKIKPYELRHLKKHQCVLVHCERGFAWTSHVLSTTAKIANVYWLHYAYWPDQEWLRTTGYPVIRGTAEFYRNFPNLYKGADGKYHIRYVNNLEDKPSWGGADTPEELLAIRVLFPIAIRASEILDVDADLRPKWKEVWDNLLPVPAAPEPGEYYDICTPVSDDTALFNSLKASYTGPGSRRRGDGGNLGILSREPVIAANLGMGEPIKTVVPGQMHSNPETNPPARGGGRGQLRNRMMMGEGAGAIEFEQLGNASHGLQNALLQSVPPSAEKEPINTVFPAWPKGWDAQFTLAARGAFLISASMRNDQIEFVEILSEKGGSCTLRNPWPDGDATVYRNGQTAEGVSGKLLILSTTAGERIALVPKGKVPAAKPLQ